MVLPLLISPGGRMRTRGKVTTKPRRGDDPAAAMRRVVGS